MFKEAIKHTLFMLPLLFWMVLALFIQPTVYIEQINLYIPNGYVMIAIMAATVIWNIILFIERSFGPFRPVSSCNGDNSHCNMARHSHRADFYFQKSI